MIMPKDAWAKARIRDKIRMKSKKGASQVANDRQPYWDTHDLFKTKCWFGKYKDWLFEDIPVEYLVWLVTNPQTKYCGFTNKLRSILQSHKLIA
jgi:uncharacterized protein (DUF3820 family)